MIKYITANSRGEKPLKRGKKKKYSRKRITLQDERSKIEMYVPNKQYTVNSLADLH